MVYLGWRIFIQGGELRDVLAMETTMTANFAFEADAVRQHTVSYRASSPGRSTPRALDLKMMRTIFITLMLVASCAHMQSRAETEQTSSIGYPSVAAAMEALRARKDVRISVQAGWTVVIEKNGLTLWSFTPQGHPAYPAVVKRTASKKDGAWFINMSVLCQAEKAPCDKLVEDFKLLNEQMRQSIEREHKVQQGVPEDGPRPAGPVHP